MHDSMKYDIIRGVNGSVSMNDLTVTEPANADAIRSRILTIRGVQVMLDRDLAELYGVPTGALNQAVKRNKSRFPDRFMFRLNKPEVENLKSQTVISSFDDSMGTENLKSQFVISRWGGSRSYPYAFTEQGIAMLSSVLRSRNRRSRNKECRCQKLIHPFFLLSQVLYMCIYGIEQEKGHSITS